MMKNAFYFILKSFFRSREIQIFVPTFYLTLYSINCPNLIALLPLIFQKILGNMRIVITCLLACDVINFEISLSFLINPFFLHDQKAKI